MSMELLATAVIVSDGKSQSLGSIPLVQKRSIFQARGAYLGMAQIWGSLF